MAQYGTAWIDVRGDTSGLGRDIQAATQKASRSLGSLGTTVARDIARTTAQAAAGVTALGAAAGASLVKVGVGYNALEQSSLAAFKTLLGTKEAAEDMQASLREFAKSSPFPRQAFIEGTQRLLAFGVEADKVIHYLDGIQNAVAAAGGSAADLSNIIEVVAKIRSSSMLNIVDLTQLGNAGINAAKLIGGSMGMTEQEFRASIFGAPLRGAEAMRGLDALIDGMHRDFAGAAEGLKGTWVGAVDRIKGAWRDLGSGLVDPFVAKTGGGTAVEWANDLADSLRHIETVALPPLRPLIDHISKGLDGAAESAVEMVKAVQPTDVSRRLGQVVSAVDLARDSLVGLEGVAVGAGIAVAGIAARSVLGPLGFLVPAISPITGVLGGLVAGSKEGRAELGRLGVEAAQFASRGGRQLVESLGRFVGEIEGPFVRAVGALGSGLIEIGERAAPLLADGLDRIGPPVGRLLDAVTRLVTDALPPFVDVVAGVLPPALTLISGALEVAASAAEVLADNAWLVVPALGAIAAVRIGRSLTTGLTVASEAAGTLLTSIRNLAATRGVSTLTASLGVAKASAGGLAGSLAAGLNPAVLGVTAVVLAGGYAWTQYQRNQQKVKQSTEELTRALLEQGDDAIPTVVRKFNEIAEAGTGMMESWEKTGWSSARIAEIVTGNPGDWDKAVGIWRNRAREMPHAMREELENVPDAVRPVWEELMRLREEGVLTGDDVNKIAAGWKQIDQAASGTASTYARLGGQLAANLDGFGMTQAAQELLNTAMDETAGVDNQAEALRRLAGMFPGIAEDSGIFLDATGKLRGEMEAAALSAEDATAILDAYGRANRDVDAESRAAASGVELTEESVAGLGATVEETKDKVSDLIGKLAELAGGQRAYAAAERGVFDALDRITEGQADRLEAIATAEERVADARSRLNEARKPGSDGAADTAAIARAEADLVRATADLEEARADASRTFDITTPEGRRNVEEVGRVIEAYESLASAAAEMGDNRAAEAAVDGLNAALQRLRNEGVIPTDEALAQIKRDFGVNGLKIRVDAEVAAAKGEIDGLRGELLDLPGGPNSGPLQAHISALISKGDYENATRLLLQLPGVLEAEQANVEAHATEEGIETTSRKIDELTFPRELLVRVDVDKTAWERSMRKLQSVGGTAAFGAGGYGSTINDFRGGRASGGPVWPGTWLVGERGPELLRLSGYGQVHNASDTARMMDPKSLDAGLTDLAAAVAALATRPQTAPEVSVFAEHGINVSSRTRTRGARR